MWSFRREKKIKKILTLYVGSASVYATWIEFQQGETEKSPQIKATVSHTLPITPELVLSSLLENTEKAIVQAGKMIVEKGIGKPDQIVCFLSSPWYASQVRHIRIAKTLPFAVTPKLVATLVKKEIDLFSRNEIPAFGTGANASRIIEKEITGIVLNGYPTSDPYNTEARDLEISLLISVAPLRVVQAFTDAIAHVFHSREVVFHSSSYAGAFVMRDLAVSEDDFLFMDVGSDITDVVLVEKGAIKNVASFPYGTDTLTRTFAQRSGKQIPDTKALISLYGSGKLESVLQARTEKTIEHAMSLWRSQAADTLHMLTDEPPKTLLFLGTPETKLFYDSLSHQTIKDIAQPNGFGLAPIREFTVLPYVTHQDTQSRNLRSLIEALAVFRRYNS